MASTTNIGDPAQAPRYDSALGAWLLSRFADVAAALNEPRLSGGGDAGANGAHVAVRETARRAFSPERIVEWQRELESSARRLVAGLPVGKPVDLVREFAEPWALSVAVLVTGAAESEAPRLAPLARQVFRAAAHATEVDVPAEAKAASAELARALSGAGGAASVAVQAFVALSQTLPCFLAGAWLALFQHADESVRLWQERGLMPRAVEELLRFAGPSRAVFRQALSDVQIGGVQVAARERVVLLLAAANRDPTRFPDPEKLDLGRDATGHLAFGRGAHYCAGAQLIRAAVTAATSALVDLTAGVESIGEVEWIDGFAIRGPTALPVVLRSVATN